MTRLENGNRLDNRTKEAVMSALDKFLDQKIAECKEAYKKATPFEFERGSDLTAYYAVKNFLKEI